MCVWHHLRQMLERQQHVPNHLTPHIHQHYVQISRKTSQGGKFLESQGHAFCGILQVQLFPDGEITVSRESSDDLREGAFITDILPKIKGVLSVSNAVLPESENF